MTTTAMHLKVQRSRFLNHTLAAVAGALPALFHLIKPADASAHTASTPRDTAREAAEVRNMAYGYMQTDPGFAADLFAAADRHEWLAVH